MRRETLIGIWIGGLVLAALIYLIGPDQFLNTVLNAFDLIDYAFHARAGVVCIAPVQNT